MRRTLCRAMHEVDENWDADFSLALAQGRDAAGRDEWDLRFLRFHDQVHEVWFDARFRNGDQVAKVTEMFRSWGYDVDVREIKRSHLRAAYWRPWLKWRGKDPIARSLYRRRPPWRALSRAHTRPFWEFQAAGLVTIVQPSTLRDEVARAYALIGEQGGYDEDWDGHVMGASSPPA